MTARKPSPFRLGIFATVAVTAILTACSAPILQGYIHATGVPSTFAYAAGGRDLQTNVIGNPFSRPKADVDLAITDAMQGKNQGPTTHFTTTPSANARTDHRVVVILNPPINLSSEAACGPASSIESGPSADGRLRAKFAFCTKQNILSEVNGSVPATDDPRDPDFRLLLALMTRMLVPDIDPDTKSDDRCIPPGCQ